MKRKRYASSGSVPACSAASGSEKFAYGGGVAIAAAAAGSMGESAAALAGTARLWATSTLRPASPRAARRSSHVEDGRHFSAFFVGQTVHDCPNVAIKHAPRKRWSDRPQRRPVL